MRRYVSPLVPGSVIQISAYKSGCLIRRNDLLRMRLVLWSQEDLCDDSALIDDEGCAMQPVIFATIQLLLSPYAIQVDDGTFRIRDERKREVELLFEFLMGPAIVGAYTDHSESILLQQCMIVAKIACLDGAGGCIVRRIEEQHQFLSFEG